jgi:hypothetical protein
MMIRKLEDALPNGAVTEVEKEFQVWFENAQEKGLEYIHLSLNHSVPHAMEDVLRGVLAGEKAIENGEVHDHPAF